MEHRVGLRYGNSKRVATGRRSCASYAHGRIPVNSREGRRKKWQ